MFDINNLGDIETLKDGDQTLILRFDDEGFADLMQCDFSMLMENNTSIWYNGTYAPSGTTTANSYYINTSTGEIYSSTTSTVNGTSTTTWQKNPLMTITGSAGENGVDGKSAYDVAVANGYTGTVTQWLASLIGANGPDGTRTYFVYSVPTAAISDSRGYCRVGDYAIVTYATTGDSDPEAGQTYVYQGGGSWKGPLTISKATTGPMGPAVTLESSPSVTTTEISEGVYQISLTQNYLSLDASTNVDQTITQGSNSTAFSISNSSGSRIDMGVSLVGTTNVLSLSSAKTTAIMTVNNNGDKAFISPDGSYFDSNTISTDGSGNITAVSYLGNGNNLTVTDPTTNASAMLSTALADINANVFRPGAEILVTDSSDSLITFGYSATAGTPPPTWSVMNLSPSYFSITPVSAPNTNYLSFIADNQSSSPQFNSSVFNGSSSTQISQLGDIITLTGGKSNIALYQESIDISSSYIGITTNSPSSTYTTDSGMRAGLMMFDDTNGIIYRCTASTSSTSGSTTTYSNTWDKYYSTPNTPLYNGTNYIDESDEVIISINSGGTASGSVICSYSFNGNGLYIYGGNSEPNTMYSYNGITLSGTDGSVQGEIQTSISGGLSLTGSNNSGNSYNFVAGINGVLISTTNSGVNSSLSFNNGQFNLSTASTAISSNSTTIISSNSTTVVTGSQIILSPNDGLILYGSVPTSPTDTKTGGTFSPSDDCLYIKGTTWSRLSQDSDWQIGIVPYVSSATATSTSGTAGTTSIATEKTSGYYIVSAKVVGKCTTSGLSCFAIFENYGTCYDGTTLTLSEGSSTIHTFGTMSDYSVDMSVSGTNIVFTYNITTSASTSWTWDIVVQQKLVTTY